MKFLQSPYHSSRNGEKIDGVVIHTTVGKYEGTLNWFLNNPDSVSAHYVIKEDGSEVTQMVKEDRAAHHAGIVSKPTTPVYRGINPNLHTIGIENADLGNPHGQDRSKQLPVLASLVREICLRNNIPIDRDHVCGHREIRSTKTCPGNIDVDEVVRLAQGGMIESDMPQWLTGLLRENGIDPKDAEPRIREMFDRARKFEDSETKRLKALRDLAEAQGDVAKFETLYLNASKELKSAKDELIDSRRDLVNTQSDLSSCRIALSKYEEVPAEKPQKGAWIKRLINWILRRR